MLMEVFLRVIKSLTIMTSCMYILTSSSTSRSERIKKFRIFIQIHPYLFISPWKHHSKCKNTQQGTANHAEKRQRCLQQYNGVSLRLQVLNRLMYFVTEGIRTLPAALLLRVRPRRLVQGR